MLDPVLEAKMKSEHNAKYRRIAEWLGWNELVKMLPVSIERVTEALAAGDEHLNTIPLALWDAKHGSPARKETCNYCKREHTIPAVPGVWDLVVARNRADVAANLVPEDRGWSLSDTVCVLKYVAKMESRLDNK